MEQILEQNLDVEEKRISFSCPQVELNLQPGEISEGTFCILGAENCRLSGRVLSSDPRMECVNGEFEGSSAEICYRFEAREMEEGDRAEGCFIVVSTRGEARLPFAVSICGKNPETSYGIVSNLFHFANLAKSNPDEALGLFYSEDFRRLLQMESEHCKRLYEGLSGQGRDRRCMEEFLISTGKKQRVTCETVEKELCPEYPSGDVPCLLHIVKSGWGYVDVGIEVQGDFFYVEKTSLSENDFLGNRCELPVYFLPDKLHAGKNWGRLTLHFDHDKVRVPVTVSSLQASGRRYGLAEKRRLIVQVMEYYQDFRMKKITSAVWMQETGKLVERLMAMDPEEVSFWLLRAHLLITQERYEEAEWILDRMAVRLEHRETEEPVLWAYHLYLTTLVKTEGTDIRRAAEMVERLYKRNPGEWRLAWLLLYMAREYSKSPSRKLVFLEEQFERGCCSPVLYIETLTLLNANPALLMKLGQFETQVLCFGARRGYLNPEVVRQAVYLIRKVRGYSRSMLRFLTDCYKRQEDEEILQEICTLLIRTGRTGKQYLEWYEKGIAHNLRITRLYDYYMMSLDPEEERELPRIVLMYFSYHSNLDADINAHLYAYVIKNRERLPELYLSYREQIERFLTEQIHRRRISRDLAYLYQEALRPGMVNGDLAQGLGELVFMHRIEVRQKDIKRVMVLQQVGDPRSFPVTGGKAYVPLYGEEYTLLFEDGQLRCYGSGVPYTIERLMDPARVSEEIGAMVQGQLGFDLYQCTEGGTLKEVTLENAHRFRHLWERSEVPASLRTEVGLKLLQFYSEQEQTEQFEYLLDEFLELSFTARVRGKMLGYLVSAGRLAEADGLVRNFGAFGMGSQELLRLYSAVLRQNILVENGQPPEDAHVTRVVSMLYRRGVWSEETLMYLDRYFEGSTEELLGLMRVSEESGQDVRLLAGRILRQLLYTGGRIREQAEVFGRYAAGGADPELKASFLAKCGYDYFVNGMEIDRPLLREMQYVFHCGERLPEAAELAFLKYYGEHPDELTEEGRQIACRLAVAMVKQGIYLNFLSAYGSWDPVLATAAQQTVVEYRCKPGAGAVIHYQLRDTGEDGELRTGWKIREMSQVCGEICHAAFMLFYGENLEYYVEEILAGESQCTDVFVLGKEDAPEEKEGKFGRINEIAMQLELGAQERAGKLMEDYFYKEYMTERLFRLL